MQSFKGVGMVDVWSPDTKFPLRLDIGMLFFALHFMQIMCHTAIHHQTYNCVIKTGHFREMPHLHLDKKLDLILI